MPKPLKRRATETLANIGVILVILLGVIPVIIIVPFLYVILLPFGIGVEFREFLRKITKHCNACGGQGYIISYGRVGCKTIEERIPCWKCGKP